MENKTSKYFKYAIGEIILVVIGILIALSINNWNEGRKENILASTYRDKIINDLETDLTNIDSLLTIGKRNKKIVEGYFNYFENQQPVNIQKLIDSCSKIISDNVWKYRYTPNNHTFEDMLSSGNSTLLNEDQRYALIKLSNTQEYFLIVFEKTLSVIIAAETEVKTFIDSDLSASNFFEKINVKQTENKLVQGLMQQHIALTSYSDLLFHTTRLKNRISKETEIAIQALKN